MDIQLYSYKVIAYYEKEGEKEEQGIIAATSYKAAAEAIEDYFGDELSYITHICALNTTICSFPREGEVNVDSIEKNCF